MKQTKVTDYRPDPENANQHSERGIGMLGDSIGRVGLGRSIVTDRNGIILAGNATQERAVDQGFTDAIEVETEGDQLVVVRRKDLDLLNDPDHRARLLSIYDNRVSEVSLNWEPEVLESYRLQGVPLDKAWTPVELDGLGVGQAEPTPDPGAQIDKAEELQRKWQVQRGDLWIIGEHRLLCGDSTSAEDVARVMGEEKADAVVTDPPYGVNYDPSWRGKDLGQTVHGQKIQGDEGFEWIKAFKTIPSNVLYVWLASYWLAKVQLDIEAFGFETKYLIIWNKDLAVFSRGHYHWKHEPCLYMVRNGCTSNWQGSRKQTTVWDIPTIHSFKNGHNSEEWGLIGHSNQKPIECMVRPIENNSAVNGIIFDPFLGSGTTLVACEQTGRLGRGIEIEPKYCAVALERLSQMGLDPKRITT